MDISFYSKTVIYVGCESYPENEYKENEVFTISVGLSIGNTYYTENMTGVFIDTIHNKLLDDLYLIRNDEGYLAWYYKKMFTTISEIRDNRLKELGI